MVKWYQNQEIEQCRKWEVVAHTKGIIVLKLSSMMIKELGDREVDNYQGN